MPAPSSTMARPNGRSPVAGDTPEEHGRLLGGTGQVAAAHRTGTVRNHPTRRRQFDRRRSDREGVAACVRVVALPGRPLSRPDADAVGAAWPSTSPTGGSRAGIGTEARRYAIIVLTDDRTFDICTKTLTNGTEDV